MRDRWVETKVRWSFRPTARRGGQAGRVALDERAAALARAPLFEEMPKRALRRLARVAGVTDRREGATVVNEGASGSVFYVILEGRAKVIHKGRTVARLRSGDFFGEMSLLDGRPRTASVITETRARFLTLSARDFRAALDADPNLSKHILRVMAARLRDLEKPPAG
jgi:CRP/FNR family transcriptional regulator, cyclic AMP receptor protein